MHSAAAEAAHQIQAYGFIREMIYSHIIMQYKQYHRRTANALQKWDTREHPGEIPHYVGEIGDNSKLLSKYDIYTLLNILFLSDAYSYWANRTNTPHLNPQLHDGLLYFGLFG
jgi:hypothetical protein